MSVVFSRSGVEYDSGLCLRGLNLLGHAQMIELFIGSQCGGHGKCGKDRVILDAEDSAKVNPPTELERIHLGKLLDQGYRLACQCFPNDDELKLRVFLPE